MDINRIRYFLSLARTGSMTKAAALHQISTPALSKAIRVFESELNEKLIVPDGRGILLTDRARAIVPALEEAIQKLSEVIDKKDLRESPSTNHPPLRISTFEVFSTHFMERALADKFEGHPCLLYEMTPGQMEEAVAKGISDFGLTYLPIPHRELDHLRIHPIEMGIFGLRKLAAEFSEGETPFVVPVTPIEGSPNKVRGLDGWPDDAFPRRILYRVGMMETALGICRRGKAVAYLPKFVARLHNEIVKPEFTLAEIPIPRKFPIQKTYVYLIKRKTDFENHVAKRLAATVRKYCRE